MNSIEINRVLRVLRIMLSLSYSVVIKLCIEHSSSFLSLFFLLSLRAPKLQIGAGGRLSSLPLGSVFSL
jgi:phosphatidylinositol kinase/protein kinase (PI-3  family)